MAGKKLLPVPKCSKYQMIRFLNKIYGGSMDRGQNMIQLTRRVTEQTHLELKTQQHVTLVGVWMLGC